MEYVYGPDDVWDVLVWAADADDTDAARLQFRAFWDDRFSAREFRFMGSLGFGGKVWFREGKVPWVSCYREDETGKRRKTVERTNAALRLLAEPQS